MLLLKYSFIYTFIMLTTETVKICGIEAFTGKQNIFS